MAPRHFDMIFVGGGLAALLFLRELGSAAPARIAVIDPQPPGSEPPHHWSYWSRERTPYDAFAIGNWQQARISDHDAESLHPYTLRLVRSTTILEALRLQIPPVTQLTGTVTAISRLAAGAYVVASDAGALTAGWVFDSATGIGPRFPRDGAQAMLSGSGMICESTDPVFGAAARLFDPLPSGGFAYVLPLSNYEALVESAYFQAVPRQADHDELQEYVRTTYGSGRLTVTHREWGVVPLGFAQPYTTGPQHILLGTKRGLVKASAGYGILRIWRESARLATAWKRGEHLPVSRRYRQPWQMMDRAFLQLATADPAGARTLMARAMEHLSLRDSLAYLDEDLPPAKLAGLMLASLPLVRPYIRTFAATH